MTRSMTRNRFRFTAGVLGIGALVLAAGCSYSPSTSASATSAAKVTLVVYSAQGYDHAMTAADRVGVLEQGRLIQTGTPEEIYTRPATPFVARFTGLSGELPGGLGGRDPRVQPRREGLVPVDLRGRSGCERDRAQRKYRDHRPFSSHRTNASEGFKAPLARAWAAAARPVACGRGSIHLLDAQRPQGAMSHDGVRRRYDRPRARQVRERAASARGLPG